MKLLHENASAELLLFFKRWVFGIWFLIIAFDPVVNLAHLPASIIEPKGALFQILPIDHSLLYRNQIFLWGLKVITICSLVCILFRIREVAAGLVACLLLTIHQSLIRSFGFSNHAEMGLLYVAYLLALLAWADHYVLSRKGHFVEKEVSRYGATLIIILFFVTLCYSMIGIHRIFYGKIEIFTSDSLLHWIIRGSNTPGWWAFHLDSVVMKYPWLYMILKAGFSVATIIEILAPFCIINRPFRYVFLCVIIPFHILIFIFMGIFFWENLLLLILLFDFTPWVTPKQKKKIDLVFT